MTYHGCDVKGHFAGNFEIPPALFNILGKTVVSYHGTKTKLYFTIKGE